MKLRYLIFALALFLPALAHAQGYTHRDFIISSSGRPVAGATITVCTSVGTGTPCTPTATIYTDETLGTPATNPLALCGTSAVNGCRDGRGNYSFSVPFGATYVVTVTGTNITSYSYRLTTSQPTTFTQLGCIEATAPSGAANQDILYCDSTAHRWKMKNNNGSALTVAATSGDTFTTTTLTTPTLTNPAVNGTPTGTGISTKTSKHGAGASSYTAAGTSYADVDGTNLAYTVTIPTGWKLSVTAAMDVFQSTAAAGMAFSLLDGSTIAEQVANPALSSSSGVTLTAVINGDGNSHTIKLQAKTLNASDAWNVRQSSATAGPSMLFDLSPSN